MQLVQQILEELGAIVLDVRRKPRRLRLFEELLWKIRRSLKNNNIHTSD